MDGDAIYHACDQYWFLYDNNSSILQRFVYGFHDPCVPCHPVHRQKGLSLTSRPIFGMGNHGPNTGKLAITEDLLWVIQLDTFTLTRLPEFQGIHNDELLCAVAANATLNLAVARARESGALYFVNLVTGITKKIDYSSEGAILQIKFLNIKGDSIVISDGSKLSVYKNFANFSRGKTCAQNSVRGGIKDYYTCLHYNRVYVLTLASDTDGQKIYVYNSSLEILQCLDLAGGQNGTSICYYTSIERLVECPEIKFNVVVRTGSSKDWRGTVVTAVQDRGLYTESENVHKELLSKYSQLWYFGSTLVGKPYSLPYILVINIRD